MEATCSDIKIDTSVEKGRDNQIKEHLLGFIDDFNFGLRIQRNAGSSIN